MQQLVAQFQPDFMSKTGFYLAIADDHLRHQDDQPTIGIILCKTKNRVVVEYSRISIARSNRKDAKVAKKR